MLLARTSMKANANSGSPPKAVRFGRGSPLAQAGSADAKTEERRIGRDWGSIVFLAGIAMMIWFSSIFLFMGSENRLSGNSLESSNPSATFETGTAPADFRTP